MKNSYEKIIKCLEKQLKRDKHLLEDMKKEEVQYSRVKI